VRTDGEVMDGVHKQGGSGPWHGPAWPERVAVSAGQPVPQAHDAAPLRTLASGWAYAYRLLKDGRRQIVEFLLPGDPINLPAVCGVRDGPSVASLTDLVLLAHPKGERPGREWSPATSARFDALTEHVVSLGRRNAYERTAVLLLQLWQRLQHAGEAEGPCFHLPLRQEHLADHLGLSVVHVSRTLSQLRRDGLASVSRGRVVLHDPEALAELAEYRPRRAEPA
jgi:CRP-like cAMP-binding protein